MTTFYMEVPAHVQHQNTVSNQVQVHGGTNWDLSRTAVATPISPVVDPVAQLPASLRAQQDVSQKQVTVQFGLNSAVVPSNAQKLLKTISKGASVSVSGYAGADERMPDTLSAKRAKEVATRLKKQGTKVENAEGHGAQQAGAESRRVELIVRN